jgi:hypothetical protein
VAEFSLWVALSSVRHLGLVERFDRCLQRGHAAGTFDSILYRYTN